MTISSQNPNYYKNSHTDLYAWLSIALTPKIGPVTMLKLLQHFGSARNILEQDTATLSQFINKTVAKLILEKASQTDVDQTLKWQDQENNNYLITFEDAVYPEELKQIKDPPLILFAKGRIDLLKRSKFAIVGTRHPTEQGKANAYNFAKDLANNQLTIVSGMAAGVDKYAHLGALKGYASTIGVIGTGIDVVYPSSNKDLYKQVCEDGLLLSEFPLTTPALAANFPRRNRIVAGLSLGCLVIESNLDGGSLITANIALDMGREVMAIPGSIHNPAARGCHKLIKTGAKLVETTNDVLEELQIIKTSQLTQSNNKSHPILDAMGYDAIEIDKICSILDKGFAEICSELLSLELEGHIVNCGNGKYQRIFK